MRGVVKPGLFVVALTLCFGVGYSWRNLRAGELPPAEALSAMVSGPADKNPMAADEVFKLAYNRVETDYYKTVVPKQLKYAGIAGMMSSLGDPHTLFLPPVAAKEFESDTQGNFVGVGARLARDPLGAKVAVSFDDGPAYAKGMRAGDVITAVNGKSVVGMNVDDIVSLIRGQEGTIVKLTLIKPNKEAHETISIKRARITTPTVDGQILKEENVGLLTVTQFAETTTEQFDNALNKLEKNAPNGLKGLVIDLRGNPGGLLEVAADMLSRFADDKIVVKMKMRGGKEEYAKTLSGLKRDFPYPIVILMNEDTASAAEIFSGVLHDYGMATLVGEHSYGKALVQNIFKLRDGSSAKITIARYYLPSGEYINRKVDEDGQFLSGGLEPDVKSSLDPDDTNIVLDDVKTDTQLQAALKVIRDKQ